MDPALSVGGFKEKPDRQIALLRERAGRILNSNPSFRHFLISDGLGSFGSYFYQIALPGLVMGITGSTGAIAAAILLSGISRIGLMIPAGALSDVFSPKLLILIANVLRLGSLLVLTGLVALGVVSVPALFGTSFVFGIAEAIALPARGVLTRWLVRGGLLYKANTIVFGQEKLVGLAGPAAAGIILASLSQSAWARLSGWNSLGEAGAFAIQGLVVSASILFLLRVRATRPPVLGAQAGLRASPDGSLRDLASLIFHRKSLRKSFLMVLIVNALSTGPLYIGLPILAASHFSDNAGALGLLLSASGCGALLGTILSGRLARGQPQSTDRIFLVASGLLGAGLAVLFTSGSVGLAALAVIVIGAAASCVNVIAFTHIQLNTPPALLGRMMGLLNLK
jgi:MFS family permease